MNRKKLEKLFDRYVVEADKPREAEAKLDALRDMILDLRLLAERKNISFHIALAGSEGALMAIKRPS